MSDYGVLLWEPELAHYQMGLGIGTGNPGVFQGYLYPN